MRPPWAVFFLLYETHVNYQTAETGSRTFVTSKMELFVTIFNNFQSLKIVTKSSILDAADTFDPTFITDHFASHSWLLINLKPISTWYRKWSIVSKGNKDGWLLWDSNMLISVSLRKKSCALHKVLLLNWIDWKYFF